MKNRVAELQQQLAARRAEIERTRKIARDQNRDQNESESALVAANITRINLLEDEIKDLQAEREAERNMTPVRSRSGGGTDLDDELSSAVATGRAVVGRPTFGAMFGRPQASGFRDFHEWASVLHGGLNDPRIQAASMTEGIGGDGGFLVPQEFLAAMLDASLENEIVRPRARIEPMTSETKSVAGFDTSDHTLSIGGFVGAWLKEGASMSKQKGKVRLMKLVARKLGILAELSNELLSDGGANFSTLLESQLISAIGWYLDYAFLQGSGAGEPVGVINDPSTIEVAAEGSQVADTIVYENLVKMFSRLHPACVAKAIWVANPSCLPQLLTLKQRITNVAGTENVGGSWVPVLREDGTGNMTLLTRPLVITEKLPVVGDSGDIVLTDLSQYVVGLRDNASIARSAHAGFETDSEYYRAILRADGQGAWKSAMSPKAGSSLSWSVKLAARA